MLWHRKNPPLADRDPLNALFVITSMPVGGAETLLVELVRRMDPMRITPELCCLKERGPLGELLAKEIPVYSDLLTNKHDVRVLARLMRIIRRRRIDAVVTVETGDKMFWGRLAARLCGVPVICSALHTTGYPNRIERLNRLLEPITDAFIAVAEPHGRYLVEEEGCPGRKVHVIPNGIDTERFRPRPADPRFRAELGLPPGAPVVGIVAALRPEKNHEGFLEAASRIRRQVPDTRFLIVGDGPQRPALERLARELDIDGAVSFLGTRTDVPEILALLDVFVLSSRMEANPVSILEAMATSKPVVAPRVGSIAEAVGEGETGHLIAAGDVEALADRVVGLLGDPARAVAMGEAARREVVARWSVDRMVAGYHDLLEGIYMSKSAPAVSRPCLAAELARRV